MVLSLSHQPFSPHRGTLSLPLRSFVSGHLAAPSSRAPAWAALPLASLLGWRGSPCLPYPLSALARSPPAPHVLTAAGRGGREGGRAADGSERVDLVLAATRGKLTRPSSTIPQRLGAARPRPRLAPSFPCTLAVAISLPWSAQHLKLRSPCLHSVSFWLPHAAFCPLPPHPPSWRWRWRVSLVRGPPAQSPFTSQVRLRARPG